MALTGQAAIHKTRELIRPSRKPSLRAQLRNNGPRGLVTKFARLTGFHTKLLPKL